MFECAPIPDVLGGGNLWFNSESLSCDWPQNVQCNSTTTEPATTSDHITATTEHDKTTPNTSTEKSTESTYKTTVDTTTTTPFLNATTDNTFTSEVPENTTQNTSIEPTNEPTVDTTTSEEPDKTTQPTSTPPTNKPTTEAGTTSSTISQTTMTSMPIESKEFKFFENVETWSDAERACVSYGGHLASIHSHEEHTKVINLVKHVPKFRVWIGGSDEEHEGIWQWVDQTNWDYQNWSGSQPDNMGGNQNCTIVWNIDEKWDDTNCNTKKPFVCLI